MFFYLVLFLFSFLSIKKDACVYKTRKKEAVMNIRRRRKSRECEKEEKNEENEWKKGEEKK